MRKRKIVRESAREMKRVKGREYERVVKLHDTVQ